MCQSAQLQQYTILEQYSEELRNGIGDRQEYNGKYSSFREIISFVLILLSFIFLFLYLTSVSECANKLDIMLVRTFATIMPPLTLEEALETTKIHSVAGKIDDHTALMTRRPFRSPHHTISDEIVSNVWVL